MAIFPSSAPIDNLALNTLSLVGLTPSVPVRVYALTVTEPGTLYCKSGVYLGVNVDTKATLWNSTKNAVIKDDDDSGSVSRQFSFSVAVSAGTYYLDTSEFTGASGWSTYTLEVKFTTEAVPDPTITDLLASFGDGALVLDLNVRILASTVAVSNPKILYKINVPQSGTLVLRSRNYGLSVDTYGRLLSVTGAQLLIDNNSGDDSQFLITYTASNAVTLFLEVYQVSLLSATFKVEAAFTPTGGVSPIVTDLAGEYTKVFSKLVMMPGAGGFMLFDRGPRQNVVLGGRGRELDIRGERSISGSIKIGAVPAVRSVRLYDKQTGWFIRETSSLIDGSYEFSELPAGRSFFVVSHDGEGVYNAVIADDIIA